MDKLAGLSLTLRLLIVASLVVCAFLGLTGLALDRAFSESARAAIREHLRIHIFSLLAVAELNTENNLVIPDELPEAKLSIPSSGLYAVVTQTENLIVWRSHSMVGLGVTLPPAPKPGSFAFTEIPRDSTGAEYFSMAFSVFWESSTGSSHGYTFYVVESKAEFQALIRRFRSELSMMLGGVTMLLLVAQALVLRWGLAPLRRVAVEIREVEAGEREALTERYPAELNRLTHRLNALIRQRGEHLQRYRNSLADLAHSLKTPLAVIGGIIRRETLLPEAQSQLEEQLNIVDKTVEYQLQRAAASGRAILRHPVSLSDTVSKVVRSLRKVYAAKQLSILVDVTNDQMFTGDAGDLTEIVGNLLDNACKWADVLVRIKAHSTAVPAGDHALSLVINIEDDGPGFPLAQRDELSARGYRADPQIAGHGIGLAVVKELVTDVYGGQLSFERSDDLGGASVVVLIPL